MDVSLSVRYTAAERCERGVARRVLIDSDLWSEPSLDDPCTALCVIDRRLSRALQMESYPTFHNEVGVRIVRIGCREFKCIGDTALASQYRWNGPPVVGAWDRLALPPRFAPLRSSQ